MFRFVARRVSQLKNPNDMMKASLNNACLFTVPAIKALSGRN